MKLVCGLLLLITIQYSSCQEDNADQFLAHVHQYCAGQKGENINTVLEELRVLKNEVTMIRELMHWYKAANGYYYKLFSGGKTWQQAKAACESEGTILASAGLRNSTVRVELQNYFNLQSIWIGVSDIGQEGTWIWEDGVGSRGNDVGWLPGEPNDHNGNEDCVYLFNVSNDWTANDSPCSQTKAFLCEKSPQ